MRAFHASYSCFSFLSYSDAANMEFMRGRRSIINANTIFLLQLSYFFRAAVGKDLTLLTILLRAFPHCLLPHVVVTRKS